MKVLYVEDDPRDSELILRHLQKSASDFSVELAHSSAEAFNRLEIFENNLNNGAKPDLDLVLLDLNLGDGNGLQILSHIRQRALPLAVVVLTGSADEDTVVTVLRTGADDYHTKQNDRRDQLPGTMRLALAQARRGQARSARGVRLLYVESDDTDALKTETHFKSHAPFIKPTHVAAAMAALKLLPESGPVTQFDVVLLDLHLGQTSGLEVLKEIHHVRRLDLPVIVITQHGTEDIALQALKLGAVDYVVKTKGYLHHLPYTIENAFFRATARRERAELVRREKEYQTLAANLPAVVWRFDRDLNTVYVNPAVETAFGIPPKSLIGQPLPDRSILGEQSVKWTDAVKEVFSSGTDARFQFVTVSQESKKWWDARLVPERSTPETVDSVLLIAHDVTEREEAFEEVRVSEAIKSRIMDSTLDMICAIDAEGRFREAGAGSRTVFGYEPAEMIGKLYLDLVHPDDRAHTFAAAPMHTADNPAAEFQNRCYRKDRSLIDVMWSANWSHADQTMYCVARDETARNQAQAEVKRLASRLENTLESITDAFFTLDLNWRFSYINPHAEYLLRKSRCELLGKNIWDEFPEAQQGIFYQEYHRALADNCTVEIEEFYEPLNAWLQVRAYPSPEGLAVYFRDVSERKAQEELLRQNSAFIQSVLNSLSEHVCVLDKEGNIIEVNTAWKTFAEENQGDLTGYLGRNYLEICSSGGRHAGSDNADKADEGIRAVLAGHLPQFLMEYPCHIGTRKRWFVMRVTPLAGAGRGVVVSHEDISERKKSELAVEQSEKRFRSLIENGSDLITVVNGKGVIQFQSPSSLRMLGLDPAKLTGRSLFDFIHSEDIARVVGAVQGSVLYPSSPFTVQYRFRDCNDAWRYFESVGRSIPGESPEGYVVVNSRDITDARKLEEQFRQAQKMEAIGQLSGGVAHDFNNLLTVIQGHASLLEAEQNLSKDTQDSIQEIIHASERATNLTRQLLTFSRRQAMQSRDLGINEVVNQMTKLLQRVLGAHIEIQIKHDPRHLHVHGDPGMLEQVLLNLAVNSRDAMPNGGRLVIETSSVDFDEPVGLPPAHARAGSFVCLTVSDTGVGIPKKIISRIFEPFFTTKPVGKGTGLGLATVYGVVQQHHGWLNVYSEENIGTTFRVYLPRITRGERKIVQAPSDTVRGGDETILIVEDEPALRALVKNILSRLGYRILEAASGVLAVDVWKTHRDEIALVITDLVMPDGMTGMQLGKVLHQESPDLKIIYTSGYSAEIAGGDFPLIEGENFVAKPYAPRQLARTVRARLDD